MSKRRLVALFSLSLSGLSAWACGGYLVDEAPPQGGAGGGGGTGGAGGGTGGASDLYPNLACDPLVPSYCGFPFPSNVYTIPDETTVTGRRVSFLPEGMPKPGTDHENSPEPWSSADGFSPGGTILAHFPDAVATGLPMVDDLAASLTDDSPTLLIEAETGERVLHWSELDNTRTVDGQPIDDGQRSLMIHPAVPLKDGVRYLVAIRGLVDAAGDPLAPVEAFKALRDGDTSEEPSVEARRALYEDIFALLDQADVPKADLQLAWDFTTASRESNTGWLLHMRDEAFELVGEDGPAYTITDVDTTIDPVNIAFKLTGTMEVPLYLDTPEPGGRLLFGTDGNPEPNPTTPTYQVEWELLIPQSALLAPAKLVQYGHGLLGSHTQVESEHFRTFCNTYNYAIFSTKLVGMAEEDEAWITARIVTGQLDGLTAMFDRLHQGMINNLLVMRMVSAGLTTDPIYGPMLDGDSRYYWGISQGGIMGGVLMSLSPDVARSTLEVMGQSYSVLLNRSVDFVPFFGVLALSHADARQRAHFLGLVQMGWDRVEPNGYTKYAVADTFPGLPANRRILMRVALGDHQVTTYGAHIMARAMNATHLDTGIRDVYGLTKATGPIDQDGAVYAEWDFGLPPEPLCNQPLSVCEDPHGKLRKLDSARAQIDEFFRTGVVANTCLAGVCDESALSGCVGGEDPNPCDD